MSFTAFVAPFIAPLAASVAPLAVARPAQEPAVALDTARITAALRAELEATGTPGAALAVVLDGRVVHRVALGVRSAETREPMTPEALVRIGSVTKSFTGLTAALLAAEGRVDLDAPIARYAPELDPAIADRTLRQLLTHTAGFSDEAARDGSHDDEALERRVRSWGRERLLGEAGDVHAYASTGYWLAGYVLQRVAGAMYADVVERRVLAPLGMRASTFRPLVALTRPLALDHRVASGRAEVLRPFQDDVSTWPSGSLFSNVDDLARYAIALMDDGRVDGRQALPAGVTRALLEPLARVPGAPCGYALGLSVCDGGPRRTASHYGFRVGSGAVFALLPERRAAVIILANRNGAILRRTEQAAVELLEARAVAAGGADRATTRTPAGGGAARAAAGAATSAAAAPAIAAPARPTPADRARFIGRWANGATVFEIALAGDSLAVHYAGTTQPARLAAPRTLELLGPDGAPVQRFQLVRGARSGREYLHDGLSALAQP